MSSDKCRMLEIDVAKGIGILLVVLLHVGMVSIAVSNFVNLFHMSIFFTLSGYCFSDKKFEKKNALFRQVWGKIKGLYLPYVFFNGGAYMLTNIFIDLNLMTNDERFLGCEGSWFGITNPLSIKELQQRLIAVLKFSGEHQFGGASWFLRALFLVSVTFFVIGWITYTFCTIFTNGAKESKDKFRWIHNLVQLMASLILLVWGYQQHLKGRVDFHNLYASGSFYFCYFMGYYLRQKNFIEKLKEKPLIDEMMLAILWFIILLAMNKYVIIAANANIYPYVSVLITCSVCGILLILYVSEIMKRLIPHMAKIISILGRNTMQILLGHFLAFKLVTFVEVIFYGLPMFQLAAYPVMKSTGIWGWLYLLTGIMVPLFLVRGIKKCNWYIVKILLKVKEMIDL